MGKLADKFLSLDAASKRKVHIKACTIALAEWYLFCSKSKKLSYRDSAVFMKHHIDTSLPGNALQAVIENTPCKKIGSAYLEPISALQDFDCKRLIKGVVFVVVVICHTVVFMFGEPRCHKSP